MVKTSEFQMLAKTFKGLEQVLAQELIELGANDVQIERRAVSFRGDLALLYRANLCLRTASRVLLLIKNEKLRIKNDRLKPEDALYEAVKGIDWSRYMTADTSFAIDATVYSETFRNSRFVTYRVKDAIADYWQEKAGRRPNVKVTDPDLYINVHIAAETVTVSLDSSGESLHKRGYRVANTEAPINEALAAGMLLLAGWKGQSDFYDPMCGSGTLPIKRHSSRGISHPASSASPLPSRNGAILMRTYGASYTTMTARNARLSTRYTARTPHSTRSSRRRRT